MLSDTEYNIITYIAESCITWEEGVNSKYNPLLPDHKNKAFFIEGDMVMYNYGFKGTIDNEFSLYIRNSNGGYIFSKPEDKIIDGQLYYAD